MVTLPLPAYVSHNDGLVVSRRSLDPSITLQALTSTARGRSRLAKSLPQWYGHGMRSAFIPPSCLYIDNQEKHHFCLRFPCQFLSHLSLKSLYMVIFQVISTSSAILAVLFSTAIDWLSRLWTLRLEMRSADSISQSRKRKSVRRTSARGK